MFPRTLHQVWLGTATRPIELRLRFLALCPGWRYELWNEDRLEQLTDRFPRLPQALARARRPAEASDLVRLAVLALHGGLYLDCDCDVLRPVETALPTDSGRIVAARDVSLDLLNNCVLGGEAGDPFWIEYLDTALDRALAPSPMPIPVATGPYTLSLLAAKREYRDRVFVLKPPVFQHSALPCSCLTATITHACRQSWAFSSGSPPER